MTHPHEKYPTAPVHILDSIRAYAESRRPTGGFVYALLTNDLMGALRAADDESAAGLFDIMRYVRWETPAACHGSRKIVANWLAGGETLFEDCTYSSTPETGVRVDAER